MKTLKERVLELKKEVRQRIIDGDFDVVKIEDNTGLGYFNPISISIDGIGFKFSVHRSKTFFSQHEGSVIIDWNGYEIGELKHLYKPLEVMELELKQKQLKQLQDEIRALQTK